MEKYYINEYIKIGKRINNSKRKYILVNLLQGKHIPISPNESLDLMNQLGEKLSRKYSENSLVIAFAETATAIGSQIASNISCDCFYIHTTREKYDFDNIIFNEEHSHASTHYLYYQNFENYLDCVENIIIIDDEISTGKTAINLIDALLKKIPILKYKQFVIASIINRMSQDCIIELKYRRIEIEYLEYIANDIKIENLIDDLDVDEGKIISPLAKCDKKVYEEDVKLPNPRFGVKIDSYIYLILDNLKKIIKKYDDIFNNSQKISIVGTEECMFPAILLGKEIEDKYKTKVYTHSTTRSPIGVSNNVDYPITKGYRLTSFYDENRTTYLYNCVESDTLIIITDARKSIKTLNEIFNIYEYKKAIPIIIYIRG